MKPEYDAYLTEAREEQQAFQRDYETSREATRRDFKALSERLLAECDQLEREIEVESERGLKQIELEHAEKRVKSGSRHLLSFTKSAVGLLGCAVVGATIGNVYLTVTVGVVACESVVFTLRDALSHFEERQKAKELRESLHKETAPDCRPTPL